MNKIFSLLCILITASSISGCAQQLYAYRAAFFNACTYPVQVTVSHYSNLDSLANSRADGLVEPRQIFAPDPVLLMTDGVKRDVKYAIADNYKLEISANGKTISLDKAGFLKVLEDAKLDHSFFTTVYEWTINDPKLCP